jgi:hypothetical protein
VPGVAPGAIAVVDLNRDGKSYLVVTSVSSGSIAGRTLTEANPQGIVIADFNCYGKLDLVVANYDDSTTSILLGDGTFAPRVTFATGFRPGIVSAVDLNSDGKLDLAVVNSLGISIHLVAAAHSRPCPTCS